MLPFVLTAVKNAQTVPIRKFAEDATPAKTAQEETVTSATTVKPVKCVPNMFVSAVQAAQSVLRSALNATKNVRNAPMRNCAQPAENVKTVWAETEISVITAAPVSTVLHMSVPAVRAARNVPSSVKNAPKPAKTAQMSCVSIAAGV